MNKKPARASQQRPQFTPVQRDQLLQLGLFREQIQLLQSHLPSIVWRQVPSPRMQDVRDKLTKLAKLLGNVESLYGKLCTGKGAAAEAYNRLYLAQDSLRQDFLREPPEEERMCTVNVDGSVHAVPAPNPYENHDVLHDSLQTATTIVNRALTDLPKTRRSTRRNSADHVRQIRKALELGHGQRFQKQGEVMPPFLIKVARNGPFVEIVRIVSDSTGGWSVDDAIRAYLHWEREEKARGNQPRRPTRAHH